MVVEEKEKVEQKRWGWEVEVVAGTVGVHVAGLEATSLRKKGC